MYMRFLNRVYTLLSKIPQTSEQYVKIGKIVYWTVVDDVNW